MPISFSSSNVDVVDMCMQEELPLSMKKQSKQGDVCNLSHTLSGAVFLFEFSWLCLLHKRMNRSAT